MKSRTLLASAAAAIIVATTGVASAMPGGGMRHGGMPFAFGERIHAKLALNPAQEAQWQTAAKASDEARRESRATFAQLREAAQAELAKDRPDLAALAQRRDRAMEENMTRQRQVRAEWLKLYDTLSPEQVAVVKQHLADAMSRAGKHRGPKGG